MPQQDGLEVMKTLSGLSRSVNVIAMTGGGTFVGTDVLLDLSKLQGALSTLRDPFGSEELIEAVRLAGEGL